MKRAEIKNIFSDVVDFSGVEQFIDTPLKHYSSGMQLRLAFAVAAFLQNEILVVDEILAVGDIEFQKKCLGKMGEVSRSGRTVLFVSHDLNALSVLTKKSILLNAGTVEKIDSTEKVIAHYFDNGMSDLGYKSNKIPKEFPVFDSVNLITSHPENVQAALEKFTIEIVLASNQLVFKSTSWLSIHIKDIRGRGVIHLWVNSNDISFEFTSSGKIKITCEIPSLKLYMGKYFLNLYLSGPPGSEIYDKIENICPFEVVMLNVKRDYPFEPDACVYLENAIWCSDVIQ
jgi:lipopolysaccharide transport system ATP-binding protein